MSGVTFGKDSITVTKAAGEWQHLKPMILGAIMEHFMSGASVLRSEAAAGGRGSSTEGEVVARIRDALRRVIDPELGCNIVDLGLVHEVAIDEGGVVHITMTTTTPGCPATNYLKTGAGTAAGSVPGVQSVDVQLTYEPRWTPQMMSPQAKARFRITD